MTVPSRPDSVELGDYLRPVRRRWPVVLILALIGTLAGLGYAKLAPKTYTAAALLRVNPLPNSANQTGGRTAGLVNMDNAVQVMQSTAVAALAAKALHSPLSPQDLARQISVSVPPNTVFLKIGCSQSSAAAAAKCANAFAGAFLTQQRSAEAANLRNALTAQDARITYLESQIKKLRSQLRTLRGSPLRLSVQQRMSADRQTIRTLQANASSIEPVLQSLGSQSAAGTIYTPAVAPTSPSSPRLLLAGSTGLLAGLLIGLVAALTADRRDKRVHSARDVDRFVDVPVLLDAAPRQAGQPTIGLASPRSRTGQAFTELAQYVATSLGDGSHVVLIAGTAPGAGAGVVAANLAAALARTRSQVVLVCTDPAGTATPGLFGIGDDRGLADALAGTALVSDVAQPIADMPRLRVITPGADTGAPLQLHHDTCRRVLSELHREAQYVIIEAQSVGQDGESFVLAEFADAALLAIEIGRTLRPDAVDCAYRLDRLRTPVLGSVLLPPALAVAMAHPRIRDRQARMPLPSARPGARPQPDGADPWARPQPQAARPAADNGLTARGPGDGQPVPRVELAPKLPGERAGHENPADRVAGG